MDFPVGSVVKNLPAMQETRVWSLGWEDPLGKAMATHSSIPAWKIPWTEEPGGLLSASSLSICLSVDFRLLKETWALIWCLCFVFCLFVSKMTAFMDLRNSVKARVLTGQKRYGVLWEFHVALSFISKSYTCRLQDSLNCWNRCNARGKGRSWGASQETIKIILVAWTRWKQGRQWEVDMEMCILKVEP